MHAVEGGGGEGGNFKDPKIYLNVLFLFKPHACPVLNKPWSEINLLLADNGVTKEGRSYPQFLESGNVE